MEPNQAEKMRELLSEVLEKTRANQVSWATTGDSQTFLYSVGSAVLRIYPKDMDSTFPFVLEVLNADGLVVGRLFTYTDEREETKAPWADELEELWNLARDRALKVSETLDLFLDSLKDQDAQ